MELLAFFTGKAAESWVNFASLAMFALHELWLIRVRSRKTLPDKIMKRIS